MDFTAYGRPLVLILALGAAVCVTAGSWMRVRRGARRTRADAFLIYFGYLLFGLSIAGFIALGFANG
ncbi:MAG: hypothetical protein ABFD98_12185 [Syntrophobacteraceae bacterium]|nr:hypothetical protein [Desulfobacteraceae bacterium]